MSRVFVAIFSLILTGCTVTKSELSVDTANNVGTYWVATQKCGEQGLIEPALASFGFGYLNTVLAAYNYDPAKLNKSFHQLYLSTPPANELGCNRVAMLLSERKQQISANNLASDEIIRNNQTLLNSTKSTNTYCNRFGGTQTFCNTY